ncbi:hypothetical protein GKJPGBOP_00757 [Streptomyces paromomycinus]|uniref:Uncharacterized protein n=1 Tax=Streptomyces paromomycinus TaxID=92743 RepID=A0A401VVK6_STREY|nr:hypothetical protein GKJPGBOP_00757 [Streptomyces paromomycinus]
MLWRSGGVKEMRPRRERHVGPETGESSRRAIFRAIGHLLAQESPSKLCQWHRVFRLC